LASTPFTSGMTSLPASGVHADVTITRKSKSERERARGREGERESERGGRRDGERDERLRAIAEPCRGPRSDPCVAFYRSYHESATFWEGSERTRSKTGVLDFRIGFTVDEDRVVPSSLPRSLQVWSIIFS